MNFIQLARHELDSMIDEIQTLRYGPVDPNRQRRIRSLSQAQPLSPAQVEHLIDRLLGAQILLLSAIEEIPTRRRWWRRG